MVSFAKPDTESTKLQISIARTDEEFRNYVMLQVDTLLIEK